jgi:hypothetical protein
MRNPNPAFQKILDAMIAHGLARAGQNGIPPATFVVYVHTLLLQNPDIRATDAFQEAYRHFLISPRNGPLQYSTVLELT